VTEYICNPQNAPSRCARTYRTHTWTAGLPLVGTLVEPGSSAK
jgi:hypothetical protein